MVLFNDNGQSQGGSITLSGFQISDEFELDTGTCGAVIAAGKHCTVYVTFAPARSGNFTGALTIKDNASNAPQTVSLTGTGIAQ